MRVRVSGWRRGRRRCIDRRRPAPQGGSLSSFRAFAPPVEFDWSWLYFFYLLYDSRGEVVVISAKTRSQKKNASFLVSANSNSRGYLDSHRVVAFHFLGGGAHCCDSLSRSSRAISRGHHVENRRHYFRNNGCGGFCC